jgi:hypothetical protein
MVAYMLRALPLVEDAFTVRFAGAAKATPAAIKDGRAP